MKQQLMKQLGKASMKLIDDVYDLLAYLISAGNPEHKLFEDK
jgi:hypothetical protein